jgi:dephospho-CoA kinase
MKPLQIGLTGGIGCGKSLLGRIFQTLGIPHYDADSRAKYVMTTDGILISNIKKEFGELSFYPDGSLNRRYLSEQVFHDAKRLAALNKMVHPVVFRDYEKWVSEHTQYEYIIKEAALLFESGSYKLLDSVIVVYAPEAMRISRVLQRDKGRSADQVRRIIAQQLPVEEQLKLADAVIWNDESRLVIPQVLKLHDQFSTRGKHRVPS